jgi:hypothetical protein
LGRHKTPLNSEGTEEALFHYKTDFRKRHFISCLLHSFERELEWLEDFHLFSFVAGRHGSSVLRLSQAIPSDWMALK